MNKWNMMGKVRKVALTDNQWVSNTYTIAHLESQQLIFSLWKFYGSKHDFIARFGMSVSQITREMFRLEHS